MVLRIFKNQLRYILCPEGKNIRATMIHWELSQNVWGFFWPECKTGGELLFVLNCTILSGAKIRQHTIVSRGDY